jgi:general secretion pathway protein D
MLAIGALVTSFGVARAQSTASPTPASLVQILLISESPRETKLRLTFSPKANTFGPVAADSGKAALGFALSSRGNAAVSPPRLNGFVRQIIFDQFETVLILRFETAQPASVSAAAVSPTVVDVTVSNGVQSPAKSADTATLSGPLPAARQADPGQDGYELVLLKYADVSEVVGLLSDGLTVKSNDLFIPREPAFGSNSLTGGGAYNPGPISPIPGQSDQPLGQSIDSAIAIDRRLNAMWLKGSPERIARMKAQIALIDVPVDSVILETELVELTESGARAVGIDFANTSGQIAVATYQVGQYVPPGYSTNAPGPGLRSVSLQMAINAQVQKGQGKIVSRPRIAALSGSTAKIITGDALPILTSITLSGVNGVSQQVQYVNVGVTLQIAPRVSPDGFVSSHVFCVVSSVTGFSQGYPTISQREAETSTTVHDGDSFVIGGLTQESSLTSRTKIPILGDIPLLGQAFRTDRGTKAKTELYIVVTPHVVRRHS